MAPALHVAFFLLSTTQECKNLGVNQKVWDRICAAPACLHSQLPAFDPSKKVHLGPVSPPPALPFLFLTYKSDSLDWNYLDPTSIGQLARKVHSSTLKKRDGTCRLSCQPSSPLPSVESAFCLPPTTRKPVIHISGPNTQNAKNPASTKELVPVPRVVPSGIKALDTAWHLPYLDSLLLLYT